jgi:hypothetical protein
MLPVRGDERLGLSKLGQVVSAPDAVTVGAPERVVLVVVILAIPVERKPTLGADLTEFRLVDEPSVCDALRSSRACA